MIWSGREHLCLIRIVFFLWYRAFQLKQLAEWQCYLMTLLNRLSLASSSGLYSRTEITRKTTTPVEYVTHRLHLYTSCGCSLRPFLNKSLCPERAAAQQRHAIAVGNSWRHTASSLLGTLLKYYLMVLLRKPTATPLALHIKTFCKSFDRFCSDGFKRTQPQHPRRGQKTQIKEGSSATRRPKTGSQERQRYRAEIK